MRCCHICSRKSWRCSASSGASPPNAAGAARGSSGGRCRGPSHRDRRHPGPSCPARSLCHAAPSAAHASAASARSADDAARASSAASAETFARAAPGSSCGPCRAPSRRAAWGPPPGAAGAAGAWPAVPGRPAGRPTTSSSAADIGVSRFMFRLSLRGVWDRRCASHRGGYGCAGLVRTAAQPQQILERTGGRRVDRRRTAPGRIDQAG